MLVVTTIALVTIIIELLIHRFLHQTFNWTAIPTALLTAWLSYFLLRPAFSPTANLWLYIIVGVITFVVTDLVGFAYYRYLLNNEKTKEVKMPFMFFSKKK